MEWWKRTRTGVLEYWSAGMLEYWRVGLKVTENVCKKISNGIPGVLSCGFSITPSLHYSIILDTTNLLVW
jgi:hypothetical protein